MRSGFNEARVFGGGVVRDLASYRRAADGDAGADAGELLGHRGDGAQRAVFAASNASIQALHQVAAEVGKHTRRRMDPELFLEVADDGVARRADGVSRRLDSAEDATPQAAHEVGAELGKLAGQLDSEIAHDAGEGLVEEADRAPVEDQRRNAGESAVERLLDLVPKTAEEGLDRIPVFVDEVGADGDGGDRQADRVHHEYPTQPHHGGTDAANSAHQDIQRAAGQAADRQAKHTHLEAEQCRGNEHRRYRKHKATERRRAQRQILDDRHQPGGELRVFSCPGAYALDDGQRSFQGFDQGGAQRFTEVAGNVGEGVLRHVHARIDRGVARVGLALHRAFGLLVVDQRELASVFVHVAGQLGGVVAEFLAKEAGGRFELLFFWEPFDGFQHLENGPGRVLVHAELYVASLELEHVQPAQKAFALHRRDREFADHGVRRGRGDLGHRTKTQEGRAERRGFLEIHLDHVGGTGNAFHDVDDVAALGERIVVEEIDGVAERFNVLDRYLVELADFADILADLIDRQIESAGHHRCGLGENQQVLFPLDPHARAGLNDLGDLVGGHRQFLGHRLDGVAHLEIGRGVAPVGVSRAIDLASDAEHRGFEVGVGFGRQANGQAHRGAAGHQLGAGTGPFLRRLAAFCQIGLRCIKALFLLVGSLHRLIFFFRGSGGGVDFAFEICLLLG